MIRLKLLLIVSLFFIAFSAEAASPVLRFTDLTSGPDTGIGDGLGVGSIVTVWGQNLGSSQGTSKIYFRDSASIAREAAYIYKWGNATAQAGYPSDTYTYHKMQVIAFSIPDSANGAGKIYVTVNGTNSNELDFSVRNDTYDKFYWVKTTGSDTTGDGSWNNPFRHFHHVLEEMYGDSCPAGTIVYGCDGTGVGEVSINNSNSGIAFRYAYGTAAQPIAVIAYPGATVTATGTERGILCAWGIPQTYAVISKIVVKTPTGQTGIEASDFTRVVGCEITDDTCADGQSGAITSNASGGVYYGNYIHDWGCATTSGLEHTVYYTNRTTQIHNAPTVAYNLLKDNIGRNGLHWFDEGDCGNYDTTLRIHDNVVVNQIAHGIAVCGAGHPPGDVCWSMGIEVYNNLLIDIGKGIGSSPVNCFGVSFACPYLTSHVKFYNNTIVGYGSNEAIDIESSLFNMNNADPTTWDCVNNLVVDTIDEPYQRTNVTVETPILKSNNLFYNGGDSYPASAPTWLSGTITSNPNLTSYKPDYGSPAIDAGTSTGITDTWASYDMQGILRSSGSAFDIGAFEYDEGESTTTTTATIQGISITGVTIQ